MNDKLINISLYDEKWMESLATTIFDDIAELTKDKQVEEIKWIPTKN